MRHFKGKQPKVMYVKGSVVLSAVWELMVDFCSPQCVKASVARHYNSQ